MAINGETSIVYDYEIKQVRIQSDRDGVINGILRRLGTQEGVVHSGRFLTIPMHLCRNPSLIVKLLNPDERQAMSDEQKAALRLAGKPEAEAIDAEPDEDEAA
ncbi:hypothetical protein H6F86_21165 [Phormidium sp. FACHB-592]|uniref:Uncharacterized protein n=1 Tax=Stenomitos frigidus AS-A4 TaxID=2933935 RepID=A0ABV0KHD9_9CYAN|nr:hypothetical protein [Phormidium sp. FACHB-592]MBD2076346.1 hypothetical protein [Phormidium sp. FACHB-592]